MIRLTALLRRNPALSAEEFQAHWRDVHAAKIRSVPGIERWLVRYEQHPRHGADRRWTGTAGIDGMTLQWYRTLDDFEAMIADPTYREVVGPDERFLLDLPRCVFLLSDEPRTVIEPGWSA
jgi:EthD domain-containing protein